MCHPLAVPAFGALVPPTLVASPLRKTCAPSASLLRVSHCPQKPTYDALRRVATADMELAGSDAVAVAPALPGADRVPRSKTFSQVSVEPSAAEASVMPELVLEPLSVSTTSRPAVSRCLALVPSIAKGLENFEAVRP